MQRQAEQDGERWQSVRAIENLLDYAMIGGAELRLPIFVLLIRVARRELLRSVGAHSPAPRIDEPAGLDVAAPASLDVETWRRVGVPAGQARRPEGIA